ncbi:MAG: DUF835 domain-containing protein [Candidatus Thermoplasmatota archaeon]|nr:DUF835 domain-containing protein [Candidatus Thermoplasmatota archaeon]
MRAGDAEFVQILSIIQRGQRLIVQARREGVETSLAEEYLSEAKYALKINNREAAIEYSKKAIYEVVQAKKDQDSKSIQSREDLAQKTKSELRKICSKYGLEAIGLKDELVDRVWSHIMTISSEIKEAEPVESVEGQEPARTGDARAETVQEAMKKEWDAVSELDELTPGLSYLVEEKRPDKIFKLYRQALDRNMKGMAISRTNPKILAKRYGITDTDSIWLTGKEIHGDIRSVLPILEFLMSIIEEFIEGTAKGMIVLDGLEYLLTNNKFNSVLRFLRQLVDNVSQTEFILLVAISPDAIEQTELTLLEKDLLPMVYPE